MLKFETPLDEEASDADIRELMSLLMTLERESLPKVTEFVPEKFLDLVQQLRTISYPALSSLFNKAPSSTARSLLLDAMPLVGSAPSLTLMQELYAEGKLSESQIDSWLTSITFIKHPRIEMISAIAVSLILYINFWRILERHSLMANKFHTLANAERGTKERSSIVNGLCHLRLLQR